MISNRISIIDESRRFLTRCDCLV